MAPKGHPIPVIRGERDNQPLIESDRIKVTQMGLKIRSLQEIDAGSYTCIAENIAGSISSNQVEVNIFTRPIIEPLPKFVTLPSSSSSTFSDITIQCSARGNPTPKVKWISGLELRSQIGIGNSKLITRKESKKSLSSYFTI